jgi:capsular exopolysaccharide synthesis family protein
MGKTHEALERAQKEYDENLLETSHMEKIERKEFMTELESNESLKTELEDRSIGFPTKALMNRRIASIDTECKLIDYYKVLRSQILQKLSRKGKRTLLVTSSLAGEGKSLTALNLAISFAKVIDLCVVLVEADLRRPVLQKYLGFPPSLNGLTDYLLDGVPINELLVNSGIPKLYLLPAGKSTPDSAELLSSARMKQLIEDFTSQRTNCYIIFDTPSLLEYPDTLVFSEFVNDVLMVVGAETTPLEKILEAQEKIKDRNLLGFVLNGINPSRRMEYNTIKNSLKLFRKRFQRTQSIFERD